MITNTGDSRPLVSLAPAELKKEVIDDKILKLKAKLQEHQNRIQEGGVLLDRNKFKKEVDALHKIQKKITALHDKVRGSESGQSAEKEVQALENSYDGFMKQLKVSLNKQLDDLEKTQNPLLTECYENFLLVAPEEVEVHLAFARKFWNTGNYPEAIKIYSLFPNKAPLGKEEEPIITIKAPQIINQIQEIQSYAQELKKQGKEKEAQTLTSFCVLFAFESDVISDYWQFKGIFSHSQSLLESEKFLAKVIFLLDNKEHSFLEHFPGLDLDTFDEQSLYKVQLEVDSAFQKNLDQRMEKIKKLSEQCLLCSPKKVQVVQIPIEIAKILVTEKGTLNLPLISEIKKSTLRDKKNRLPLDNQILKFLKRLRDNPELLKEFSSIKAPRQGNTKGEDVVRTTLGIPPSISVTEADAKRAILAALMTNWRQGPIWSCFATAFTIQLLENSSLLALKDLKDLVEKGSISRTVEGKKVHFTGMLHSYLQEEMTPTFFVEKGGILHCTCNGKTFPVDLETLYQDPGIKAVIAIFGFEKVNEMFDLIKEAFGRSPSFPATFTIDDLIAYLQADAPPNLAEKARFAYVSQAEQGVLRLWENTLANLSNPSFDSRLNQSLEASLTYAAELLLEACKCEPTAIGTATQNFLAELSKFEFAYFFDPQVVGGNYKKSGWLLHVRRLDNPKEWVAITSAKDFRDFINDRFLAMTQTANLNLDLTAFSSPEEMDNFLVTKATQNFLVEEMREEYETQNLVLSPLENWDKIDAVPWRICQGGSILKLFNINWDLKPSPTQTIESTENQCLRVIQYCREFREHFQNTNKEFKIPVVSEHHMFSLLPFDDSLTAGWKEGQTSQDWLDRHLNDSKKQLEEPMTPEQKKRLIERLCVYFNSEEDRQKFIKLAESIPQGSIRDFLKESLKLLKDCNITLTETNLQLLDRDLLSNIFPDLGKRAIVLADINYWRTNAQYDIGNSYTGWALSPTSETLIPVYVHSSRNFFLPNPQKSSWLKTKPVSLLTSLYPQTTPQESDYHLKKKEKQLAESAQARVEILQAKAQEMAIFKDLAARAESIIKQEVALLPRGIKDHIVEFEKGVAKLEIQQIKELATVVRDFNRRKQRIQDLESAMQRHLKYLQQASVGYTDLSIQAELKSMLKNAEESLHAPAEFTSSEDFGHWQNEMIDLIYRQEMKFGDIAKEANEMMALKKERQGLEELLSKIPEHCLILRQQILSLINEIQLLENPSKKNDPMRLQMIGYAAKYREETIQKIPELRQAYNKLMKSIEKMQHNVNTDEGELVRLGHRLSLLQDTQFIISIADKAIYLIDRVNNLPSKTKDLQDQIREMKELKREYKALIEEINTGLSSPLAEPFQEGSAIAS